MFMMSSGGLTAAHLFQGKDAILSGPAGGVVGAVETARMAGFSRIIGFDMGGTSTDVSHYDGEFEQAFETEVAGVRMRAPMMRIHTVAAGGGSILFYESGRFRVGPKSPAPIPARRATGAAGRSPSPTRTSWSESSCPSIFPRSSDQSRTSASTSASCASGSTALAATIGDGRAPEEVAAGFLEVAVENMANAIKKISVARGYDVTRYALACFGGAGGQHACMIADRLGMEVVHIHPLSGLLSAYGMGLADISAIRTKAAVLPLDTGEPGRADAAARRAARRSLCRGRRAERAGGRYRDGCESASPLRRDGHGDRRAVRDCRHRRDGRLLRGGAPGAVRLRVRGEGDRRRGDRGRQASGGGARIDEPDLPLATGDPLPASRSRFFSDGAWHDAGVYLRARFPPGHRIEGAALIIEPHQTIVVEPGWAAEATAKNHIVLRRVTPRERARAIGTVSTMGTAPTR